MYVFFILCNFCFQEFKDIILDLFVGCLAGLEIEGDRKYMNFLYVLLDIFILNLEKKDIYFLILM